MSCNEQVLYDAHGWKAVHEVDNDEEQASRIWIEKRGEMLGTYEAVEEQLPDELVEAVDRFFDESC